MLDISLTGSSHSLRNFGTVLVYRNNSASNFHATTVTNIHDPSKVFFR